MTVAPADRPTVLIVISSLNMGGPQKSLVGLLQRLERDEYDVTVVVLDGKPGLLRAHLPDHVHVVFPPRVVTAATLPRGALVRSLRLLLGSVRIATAARVLRHVVWGVARRTGFQRVRQAVWHVVSGELPVLPGHFDAAVGILGLSTYYVADLVDAERRFHWVRSDVRMLARDETIDARYYDRLTGAVAVSNECARIFQDVFPSMGGRVRVYKNDIPTLGGGMARDVPAGGSASYNVLTLARLDPLKGVDLAVAACRMLRDRGRDLSWVVLGDGPERARLEQLITEADLSEHFKLPGTAIDVAPYLAVADLYVHPSRFEGRSNAVEEARAAGIPVVATAYPTVASQVEHEVTGLVSDLDAGELAAAVARMMDAPRLAAALAEAARRGYEKERDDPRALLHFLLRGQPR